MPDNPHRHLTWDGCYNIRDLGGYPSAYGTTRWGVFVRSDSLTRLTERGRSALINYGIRTIIDMRSRRERTGELHPFATIAAARGPRYYVHPLFDEYDNESIARIAASRTLAEMYEVVLDHFSGQILTVLRSIAAAPAGGVLFHCHAGKDRTGLIAMFLLAIAKVPDEIIIHDYALSDRFLGAINEEILARYVGEPQEQRRVARLLHTRPEYMRATLERLNLRYGGPVGYLRHVGIYDDEIVQLRRRLV
jgi:protein-tyrosine phosphatase